MATNPNYRLDFSVSLSVEAQEGMRIAYEHSDSFWRTILAYAIFEAARKYEFLTVDEVVEQMDAINADREKKKLPLIQTHNLAALGQAMVNSSKDGVMVATDGYRRSKRTKSHGNPLRVWKSNFYAGVKQ